MENMIRNILVEASLGEVVLTSRPRVIALPPLNTPRLGCRSLWPRVSQQAGAQRQRGNRVPHPSYLVLSVPQGSKS